MIYVIYGRAAVRLAIALVTHGFTVTTDGSVFWTDASLGDIYDAGDQITDVYVKQSEQDSITGMPVFYC